MSACEKIVEVERHILGVEERGLVQRSKDY